ncbi:putative AMP-dependent synthetase and ligase [Bradyrhizobium oligotrophicum S58]|uniref:3-methylmercaptopropionyl-CoA ligase n=1 Tax=Bradyrhizobium oligotrophicum S58 TaxID=1245469 RepID=M4ZGH4_9BRAD|nr:acyl-CoA synthetase [Bradyrhizobium oligotrophicum]BAM92913.1 putative AMP-dependent synthetase and ligase [Bradyrhizobium oligotrophicum S58]
MESIVRRQTLGDLLRRSAARTPGKTAVICGEVSWTYAEFNAVADRLGAGLAARGVGKGERVAILARNSHAFAALRFALARLGAVLVPINFMLKPEEVAYILTHAGVRLLATDSGFAGVARAAKALVPAVEQLIWLPSEGPSERQGDMIDFSELAASTAAVPAVEIAGSDVAQIVYTSGTESLPKGAMLTHDAVIWQYVSCVVDAGIAADDVTLHALPLYHCAQLDVFFGPSIYVGATNIITAFPTPDNLLPLIAKYHITSFFAPPTVWISILRSPLFETTDVSSLHKGYYGASIMPVEVLRELAQRLPKVRLWNLYGQTEIAPLATMLGPDDQLRKPGSCGRAVLNVETRVVDDDMNDVAPGAVGEVVHRSPHLMLGYFHDDERTAAAFQGDWFHSGDLATIDDEGYITIVDRKKDMIKTGGENVASREVEEALYLIPEVSEVAVVGLPHPRWVEAVVAVVVVKSGHELTEDAVLRQASSRLATFKTPKRIVFVDALPKNPSGKLLKRQLREAHAGLFTEG